MSLQFACFIKNCKDRRTKRQRLPNPKVDLSRFKKWLLVCGRADLLKKDCQQVYKNHALCKSHFSPDNFYPNCDKLRKTACPDINLPDISSTVEEENEAAVEIDLPSTNSHNLEESEIWGEVTPDAWISFGSFSENIGDQDNSLPVINRMATHPKIESVNYNIQATSAVKPVALPPREPLKETSTPLSTSPRLLKAHKTHSTQDLVNEPIEISDDDDDNDEIQEKEQDSCITQKDIRNIAEESNSAQNDEWSLIKILQSPRETPCSEKQNTSPRSNTKEVLSLKPKETSSTRPQWPHRTYSRKKGTSAVEPVAFPPNEPLEETTPLSTPPTLKKAQQMHTVKDTSAVEPVALPTNEPLEETTPPLSTPPRVMKAQKTHTIKVLGDKGIDDPTVIKSLLGKVKLKKKGTVYIVPLKGKVENKDITASKLQKIIKENTTGLNRKQLMKVLKSLKATGEIPRRKPRLRNKRQRIKNCTCRIHCLKRGKLTPTVVTSGIATRLEGNALMSDEDVLDPSTFQNLFNVSTILTNVCDKSQIEQLCQLVIESVFRLKNANKNRSMGTLTVYLGQNVAEVENDFTSENNIEPRDQVNSSATINHGFDVSPFCEKENTETLITNEDISHNTIPNYNSMDKKNVKVNLQTYHDHNYLSLESKILFQKPEYLVNLINVSTYTSSWKKTRILNFTPKQSEKLFTECKKLKKQNERLREMLKKKTLKIKSLNIEMKRLKNLLTKEQRAQLMKDRKASSDFDDTTLSVNSISDNLQNSTIIRKKRSRKKKNVDVELDVTNNLFSEVNRTNSTPAKKKNKFLSNNYSEGGDYSLQITNPNSTSVKKKKNNAKKRKAKDILTNLEISPVLNNDTLTSEISNVLEDNDEFSMYRELYESMIIDESI